MVFLLSRASRPGCCRRVSTYRSVRFCGATSTDGVACWAASATWAAGPALDDQRATPLGLGLNEGLGSAFETPRTPIAEFCIEDHSASCEALGQEQARYAVAAVSAEKKQGALRRAGRAKTLHFCYSELCVSRRFVRFWYFCIPNTSRGDLVRVRR